MRFALVPRADSRLVLEEEVRNDAVRNHPRRQRLGLLARRFGLDVLIVVAAIESAIEVGSRAMRWAARDVWPETHHKRDWFHEAANALDVLRAGSTQRRQSRLRAAYQA